MLSTEFLVTSLVVVLVPGTGVIYTVSTGLISGAKSSVAAAFGCSAGIIPHLTASILGLSAIMHMSSVAYQVIRLAGACYLLYLAWSMWKETGGLAFKTTGQRKGLWKIATRGFLINILNPKLSIFFLAFLPIFVSPNESSPLTQMLWLSSVFMGMTLIIFIFYGMTAHAVRAWIANKPIWMRRFQRSFAVMFAALGVKLVLTQD